MFGREVTSLSPQQQLTLAEQILEHQMEIREHYVSDTLLRVILLGERKDAWLWHGCCSRTQFHSCSSRVLDNMVFSE